MAQKVETHYIRDTPYKHKLESEKAMNLFTSRKLETEAEN